MILSEKLNRIPPYLCRYVARTRDGRRGLTHAEIARAAKLNVSTVKEISFALSFDNFTVKTATAFSIACGVNHLAAERVVEFLKRRRRVHVLSARGNQKKMYDRLETIIFSELERKAANGKG